MTTTEYTNDEFNEFNLLSLLCSSRNQVQRIDGRMKLGRFVEKHGKAKCDAMWAEAQRRDKEEAARKRKGKRK